MGRWCYRIKDGRFHVGGVLDRLKAGGVCNDF